MAMTFSKTRESVVGDLRMWVGTGTFDSSYPTGGEAISKSDFGFAHSLVFVVVTPTDEAGKEVKWDQGNSKLKVYDEDNTSGISAEAANASDQSGVVVPLVVFGL